MILFIVIAILLLIVLFLLVRQPKAKIGGNRELFTLLIVRENLLKEYATFILIDNGGCTSYIRDRLFNVCEEISHFFKEKDDVKRLLQENIEMLETYTFSKRDGQKNIPKSLEANDKKLGAIFKVDYNLSTLEMEMINSISNASCVTKLAIFESSIYPKLYEISEKLNL